MTPVEQAETETFQVFNYTLSGIPTDTLFYRNDLYGGLIQTGTLKEASGLTASKSNDYILWSHNDKGNPNRIYAIGKRGENYGYFVLTGAGSRDYEDMCSGPGPVEQVNYLYVGDIGNNDAEYKYLVIYRLPEPDISDLQKNGIHNIPKEQIERIECDYTDEPVDCETLMLDPLTKDLYVVSKRTYRSILYKIPYPQNTNGRNKLVKIAQLPFNNAVSGDISRDGLQIVIKDLTKLYCWNRTEKESIVTALSRMPHYLPYKVEPQGEAFTWTNDGTGYFTLSEQEGTTPAYLYYYHKKQ